MGRAGMLGRLSMNKSQIRVVIVCKGDTLEYVCRMQQELFDCLARLGAWMG